MQAPANIISIIAATALYLAAAPVTAQATVAESDAVQDEPVYVAPTLPDRIGRVMVPVHVNGQGPYAFVIDTGATRSAIAPHVVAELGLVPDPENQLAVRGVTGAANVASVAIERLEVGEIVLKHQLLPVIQPSVFADADGILGIEGLERACLHVNFVKQSVTITRNGCPRFRTSWARVPATLRFGRLIVVKGRFKGTAVRAIIDTGAARSLGNNALLRALQLEWEAEQPLNATVVLGATEQRIPGSLVVAPPLYLGEVKAADIQVTFGDFEVFRLWNLDDKPAILVGMDVLGLADALMIDYRRSEMWVLLPGTTGQPVVRQRGWPGRVP
jgi:predicted aspartyl protease